MKQFEVHCFTKQNYEKFGNQFPENSYFYDTEDEVSKCLIDLIMNMLFKR